MNRALNASRKKVVSVLVNRTRNTVLAEKVVVARTLFSKMRGLMFRRRKSVDYALVLELGRVGRRSASIHMMFVFFPIDALFLDKRKRVVDKTTLRPFQLNYTPKVPAAYVVELPAGLTDNTKIGDELAW